ncbi:hypothetical protein PIB30_072591 [Stylosanthes scabra]|uniref:Uncharacterized protein n=1 Tax=Stylosanthes scabra TaxID=79078 RepID=A0ABU6YN30_9FABA|nr:hypothetical protein [Stylosanthes scabra]
MRAPALLSQCLPGLLPHDRGSHSISSSIPDKDVHLPCPAVEILPSKAMLTEKDAGENMDQFKGKVNVADIIGFSGSEAISTKPDGIYMIFQTFSYGSGLLFPYGLASSLKCIFFG